MELNRPDRRAIERDINKKKKMIQKLTPAQTILVETIVQQESKIRADKEVERIINFLDRSMTAAMIECGYEYSEVIKIQTLINELMYEDMKKMEELEKKEGDIGMAKTVEAQVRTEVEKLIAEGINKKETINKLVYAFPKLSKSMLINAYSKVLEEKKEAEAQEIDPTVEEALEKVKDILNEDDNKEVKEVLKKSELELKSAELYEEIENKAEAQKKTNFKVLELNMKVKGENGIYNITGNEIMLENEGVGFTFQTREQWNTFAAEMNQIFDLQEEKFKEVC